MELILAAISIFAAYAVWHYMWIPTATDHLRDQLFDLRDEVRAEFVSRGIPLHNPAYEALRSLLNQYLRYTEKVNIGRFISEVAVANQQRDLFRRLKDRIEEPFKTEPPELMEYIQHVRQRAMIHMYCMMAKTSVLLISLILVAMICTWAVDFINAIRNTLPSIPSLKKAMNAVPVVAIFATLLVRTGIARETWDASEIEEYAYSQQRN
ncbi:MAG: hypothetical protein FWD77_01510 [Betaproteobacteria bacterium]|nr:hypothetical protein [Betaproteobacteria bacterium]